MTSPVALEPFLYQEPHPCMNCGGEENFVAVFECESGRLGYCEGCGDEKFVPFTRTVSEECQNK